MIDLTNYGYKETKTPPDGQIPGRVIEFRRSQYTVVTEHGELDAVLKGAFVYDATVRTDLPCVGDFVLLQYNDSGVSFITELLPRTSKFSRADFSGHGYAHIKANREQVVATNFDYVFIVTSLNRDFRINRILRYLTQARASGGTPVVILTKADLCDDFSVQMSAVRESTQGVAVHAVSSHSGFGIDQLSEYLAPGKTVVFLGMSGVGKSSLLNALAGENLMTVKGTRNVDISKGQHTTTHRQLVKLPCGAMVIDTPGMRELGLIDAEKSISEGFSDIEELFAMCRFSDCSHQSEPDCAVQLAINDGTLSVSRWEQYQTQRREDRHLDKKATVTQMRERKKQGKAMSKFSREHTKQKHKSYW
jgi:ribosome biogenesis GTPase